MTNEQLVSIIKDDDRPDLLPKLWERVRRLLFSMSDSEYRKRSEQFKRCGVTVEDLKQSCYTDVFMQAVNQYDSAKGLMFSTYLTYPFRRAVDTLLGTTNGRENHRPLDNAVSLDEPLCADTDGEPLTFADIIADDEPTPEEKLTNNDIKRIIRLAVYSLDEPYHAVISRHYFARQSILLIAEDMGEDEKQVRAICRKGLQMLRHDESLLLLMDFVKLDRMERRICYSGYCQGFDRSPEYRAAAELAGSFRAYDYGIRQAVMYEAMCKFRQRTTTI